MLLQVRPQLVRLTNLDPDEDLLAEWLKCLNVWDFELECRVMAAKGFFPLDMEYRVKDQLGLPLDESTLKLFQRLLKDDLGINLETLGCNGNWRDPNTCVGRIYSLNLARVQDNVRFKAQNPIAFDTRVHYLVGLRNNPN